MTAPDAVRLADLRITPVRRRRKGDVFCPTCGQFHERELHRPTRDELNLGATQP